MPRDRRNQYGDERITLRQTLVIAVVLHLMLGGVMQWNPDLLFSDPVVVEPGPQPLEFRFVDVPEPELPDETPDTNVMSDRDRVAADESERTDAEDPFNEGNTSQEVLRSDPAFAEPELQPQPEPTPPSPEAASAEATTTSTEETTTAEEVTAEETVAPPETTTAVVEPLAREAPLLPPPRRDSLRNSLTRGLQRYVEPEVFGNEAGGVQGQGLVQFDTKGYDLGEYIASVLRIIERNWKMNIPPAARVQGIEGAVFVNLSIDRNRDNPDEEKAIIIVHQAWSSGKPAFDQSALLALEISSPLPPLPAFFPHDKLEGRLGFLYNLDADQVTFPVQR